jgi:YD repeat-containing protein
MKIGPILANATLWSVLLLLALFCFPNPPLLRVSLLMGPILALAGLGQCFLDQRRGNLPHKRHWKLFWPTAVFLLWVVSILAIGQQYRLKHPTVRIRADLIQSKIPTWDGSYPFLVINPILIGPGRFNFKASVSQEKPTVRHDFPVNEFRVDLHSGAFILRQTDLFVPDVIPLSLTRTFQGWNRYRMAYGVGTNHPYDICPTGTRHPYTYMDLVLEDGAQVHFRRISEGTGYADAVFRHDDTSSEFYGAQIAWNGDDWSLSFRDGPRFLFPEAYFAKSFAQGAATEMRDSEGHRIQLRRDNARNLTQLTAPSGHTISFKYDGASRIVEANEPGNIREYSYNVAGYLQTVSDSSHVLYRFEYEHPCSQRWLQSLAHDNHSEWRVDNAAAKATATDWSRKNGSPTVRSTSTATPLIKMGKSVKPR